MFVSSVESIETLPEVPSKREDAYKEVTKVNKLKSQSQRVSAIASPNKKPVPANAAQKVPISARHPKKNNTNTLNSSIEIEKLNNNTFEGNSSYQLQ